MLGGLHRVAQLCWPVRWLLGASAVGWVARLIWLLLDTAAPASSSQVEFALAAGLLSLAAVTIVVVFRQLPERLEDSASRWLRFKNALHWFWYRLLAGLIVLCTLVTGWLAVRLMTLS